MRYGKASNVEYHKKKRQRTPKGQSKMDNPEKLVTQCTQEEGEKTTQYVLDTTTCKQTQIRHEPSYTQLEIKTNRTSFYGEIVKYHVDFIKNFKCQTMIPIILVHHKQLEYQIKINNIDQQKQNP